MLAGFQDWNKYFNYVRMRALASASKENIVYCVVLAMMNDTRPALHQDMISCRS